MQCSNIVKENFTTYMLVNLYLYKDPRPGKAFPEVLGGAAFLFLKDAVEIGDIVEAAVIGHFRNGLGGVDEHAGGMAEADLGQAVYKGIAGPLLEKAAEG